MIHSIITILLGAILFNSIYKVWILKALSEQELQSFLQDYHERYRPESGASGPSSYWFCTTRFIIFIAWIMYMSIKITS